MENKNILIGIAVVLVFILIISLSRYTSPTGAAVAGNGNPCYGEYTENCSVYNGLPTPCQEHWTDAGGGYQCVHVNDACQPLLECNPDSSFNGIQKEMVFIDDITCKEWNLCFTEFKSEYTQTGDVEQKHRVPYANANCVGAVYGSVTGRQLSVDNGEVPIPPHCVEEKDPTITEVNFITEIVEGEEPQIGACCYPDSSCDEVTESFCDASGGSFTEVGVICADVMCGPA